MWVRFTFAMCEISTRVGSAAIKVLRASPPGRWTCGYPCRDDLQHKLPNLGLFNEEDNFRQVILNRLCDRNAAEG